MADSVEEEIRELEGILWSERDPEGRAFAPLADAYRRRGDHGQAVRLLREGLARHESFAPGFIVAGWVRREIGEVDGADQAFAAALALDPENTEALRGLGEMAAERGDRDAAIAHYQKLNELEPDDLEIVARLRELDRPAAPVLPPASPSWAESVPVRADESETVEPAAILADEIPTRSDDGEIPAEFVVEVEASFEPLELETARPELEVPPPAADSAPDPVDVGAIGDGSVQDLVEVAGAFEAGDAVDLGDLADAVHDGDDGPITRTMADLYAKQGLHERALRVYRQLLERDPWDDEVRLRIAALEARAEAPATDPRREKRAEIDTETLARDWSEGPRASEPLATPFAWTAPTAEVPETAEPPRLVRDYFRGLLEWEPAAPEPESAAAESAVPAAGAPEAPAPEAGPEAAPAEPLPPEAGVREPMGAQPVEVAPQGTGPDWSEPAPTAEVEMTPAPFETTLEIAAVPIPFEPEPVEALPIEPFREAFASVDATIGAEPVPATAEPAIEDVFAFGVGIEEPPATAPAPPPTPIEALAPERIVPIESLAPDGIVPIESLAPVIVDIASLAP